MVDHMGNAERVGRSENFSLEQANELRAALRGYERSNPTVSQTELAAKIAALSGATFGQQSLSKFLAGGGIGFRNATGIVRLLGYDGVDAFFDDRGIVRGAKPTVSAKVGRFGPKADVADPAQEQAMGIARRLGISERIIAATNERYRDLPGPFSARSWVDRYLAAQAAADDARRPEPEKRARRRMELGLKAVPPPKKP